MGPGNRKRSSGETTLSVVIPSIFPTDDLQTDKFPFTCADLKWKLLILYPMDFLPERQPLAVLNPVHGMLHKPGDPAPAVSPRDNWLALYPSQHSPFLVDANLNPFEDFTVPLSRSHDERLSLFAVLVNADSKLKARFG